MTWQGCERRHCRSRRTVCHRHPDGRNESPAERSVGACSANPCPGTCPACGSGSNRPSPRLGIPHCPDLLLVSVITCGALEIHRHVDTIIRGGRPVNGRCASKSLRTSPSGWCGAQQGDRSEAEWHSRTRHRRLRRVHHQHRGFSIAASTGGRGRSGKPESEEERKAALRAEDRRRPGLPLPFTVIIKDPKPGNSALISRKKPKKMLLDQSRP